MDVGWLSRKERNRRTNFKANCGASVKDLHLIEIQGPRQVEMYDAAVGFWHDLRGALVLALTATHSAAGQVWKHFWAAQQRFFRLLAVSMKVLCVKDR